MTWVGEAFRIFGPAMGEVVKEVGVQWVRSSSLQHDRITLSATRGQSIDEGHCPYCLVVRRLASVHRYLIRADERRERAAIYQELARRQLREARATLAGARPPAAEVDMVRRYEALDRMLFELDDILALPVDMTQYRTIAAAAWASSDIACDLAEWHNTPKEAAIGSH